MEERQLYQYLWHNGLTNSETWRCPDADDRGLLGFRPDHSRPAMSTSAKTWELENARLRLFGTAVHAGCSRICSRSLFHNFQVPAAHQPVLTLANHVVLQPITLSNSSLASQKSGVACLHSCLMSGGPNLCRKKSATHHAFALLSWLLVLLRSYSTASFVLAICWISNLLASRTV